MGVSLVHLVGIVLFCRGFLLSRRALDRINACSPHDSSVPCTLPATHRRAVVLIIDALRFDFVSPAPPEPHSQYHHNILTLPRELSASQPDRSFLFHSYVDPPTTTLQRIKGITTGSLSTFVDMGSNFGGSEIKEDSLVVQLLRSRKSTAFMGDDTWLTVYPTAFNVSHPFSSFNVEDLHTVDEGVITHLFPLLEPGAPKWDAIIGHFLGVDHVGHRVGPDHPSMAAKLAQMDDVLRRVVQHMDDDTLLVVLGDHGMDEKGDHGGDGARETSAALWFYSKGVPLSSASASYPKELTPRTRFVGASHEHRLVQQIDLLPSLALLLGLPIPFNNLGSVIPELFGARLDAALAANAQQIWNYLKEYRNSASGGELDGSWDTLSTAWDAAGDAAGRVHFTRLALSSCRALWAQFNGTLMFIGLVLIGVGTALTLYLFLKYGQVESQNPFFSPWHLRAFPWSALPLALQAASLLSNSFILWEDRMSLFLLLSSTLPAILPALASPDARLRNRVLAYTLLLAVCTRLMSISTVSREEQAPYCHDARKAYCSATYYATGGSQAPPRAMLVLAPLAAALLPEVLRRALKISASDRGPMRALLAYLVRGALLAGSACWVLEYLESSASSNAESLRLARTIVARSSLLIAVVGGGAFWWFGPLCLDVRRSGDGKRVEILGFANAVGAPALLFVVLLGAVPLWAATQLSGQAVLLLALTALLAWLEIVDSLRDIRALRVPKPKLKSKSESEEPPPPVVSFAECAPVALLAQLAFFGTGHQATMQSIQWKAAFLLSRTLQYPWAPLLVALNAFGPLLVFGGMGAVLVGAWCAGPRALAQTERNATRAALGVMLYFSCLLLGAAASAAALRRHLMVWKVFAPRLMLACCALLAVDLGALLAVVACITWLVYDYLITLDDEVELIWMRKWSFTKVIFLLMRWTTFGLLLTEVIVYVFLENLSKSSFNDPCSHQQCDAFSWGSAIATVIVLLEVEIVLQLRIFVMYQRSRKILLINGVLCTIVVVCAAIVIAMYFPQARFVPVPDDIIGACYDVRPGILATVWISPMVYELYLAVLAVYKVVTDYRAFGRLDGGILAVLVRDSVGYFILLVIVAAVNIMSWAPVPYPKPL
ncbi:hypothetical protein AURDEDRAFT_187064 [Auricularia subglabra TFB-10046 SS5]|nr:hypothetical protein AURDEDRAFT_187064 [Auricularia subglabra TFB-10046 SS5]